MNPEIDTPKKFVWRRWKNYRMGRIALKVCPTCQKTHVQRNMKRCPTCGQLLDFTEQNEKEATQ